MLYLIVNLQTIYRPSSVRGSMSGMSRMGWASVRCCRCRPRACRCWATAPATTNALWSRSVWAAGATGSRPRAGSRTLSRGGGAAQGGCGRRGRRARPGHVRGRGRRGRRPGGPGRGRRRALSASRRASLPLPRRTRCLGRPTGPAVRRLSVSMRRLGRARAGP